jgi:hypothetical protein
MFSYGDRSVIEFAPNLVYVLSYRKDVEAPYPSMTFCPVPAFRKSGIFYSESDFDENTFTVEEMFDMETVKRLKNGTIFEYYELESIVYGRCFTLLLKDQFQENVLFLGFNAIWDVSVFLHLKVMIL